MTQKYIEQIKSQIPAGERLDRMYKALEGDIRVITKNDRGWEKRYTTIYHPEDDSVTIKEF